MGLPHLVLNESGAAKWRELVITAGYKVQLAEEEIKRCEENGESCEITGHPRLASTYPYVISHKDVQIGLIEVTEHDNAIVLSFMPLKSRNEKQLFNQVRQVLITSGAVVE